MLADFFAAYSAAKAQRRRMKAHRQLVNKPITNSAMEDAATIAKREAITTILRFKDGNVIEFHGEKQWEEQSQVRRQLRQDIESMRGMAPAESLSDIEKAMYGDA